MRLLVVGVAAQLVVALALVPPAGGEEGEWLANQPFLEGKRVLDDKGCSGCHAVAGKQAGGVAGPVLGSGGRTGDVMRLASSLWNHGPLMTRARPTLSPDQAGQVAGYFFHLNFLDRPGDVERGRVVFTQRLCARCHQLNGQGGTIGPRLDELKPYATGLFLAYALWDHGPRMAAKMAELGVERPRLEPEEVTNLLAFMRGTGDVSVSVEQIAAQTGSPRAGKAVFGGKGCVRCHAIGGAGAGVGRDLGARRPDWQVADMVAALWNHGPEMWGQMAALGISVPELGDREMSDLLAYLSFLQYANVDGDVARGAAVFRDKSCALCHAATGGGESPGPVLTGSAAARSPLQWVSTMWNHAPAVEEKIRERGLAWPRFEGDQMRDLAAFLRASGGER
jgi:mono/diheme cytochrome c family protein